MRIVVTGAGGTLGRAVLDAARSLGHEASWRTHRMCDIAYSVDVYAMLKVATPDVVINCAGALPDQPRSTLALSNAAGPHVLADECAELDVRLLHVSTDCVFRGDGRRWVPAPRPHQPRLYRSDEPPDAVDPYGRTKAYGEPDAPHVLVVRTSFVGLGRYGLLRHLLDADRTGAPVQGWRRSYWTGSTVQTVAAALVALAAGPVWGRTLHLATPRVYNKAEVCRMLIDALGLRVPFEEVDDPWIDRSLQPDVVMPGLADLDVLDVLRREVERAAV